MKKSLIALLAFFAANAFAATPLWDLQKNKIDAALTKGDVKIQADGSVILPENAAFAVPASAFPDQKNFTVQIKIKYPQIPVGAVCESLLSKEGSADSGFGLGIARNIYYENYTPRVNLMYAMAKAFGGKDGRTNADKPITFTIYAREGLVKFYLDDVVGSKIFASPLPCDEAMWVGLKRNKKFGDLEVLDLKVFGKNYEFKSQKEKIEKFPRGVRVGKGWSLDVPKIDDQSRPRILIYGDSISMGYKPKLVDALQGKVYVEHWCHFCGGTGDYGKIFSEAAASAPYDVIVFNNGLHSLSWVEQKVSDKAIQESYRRIIKGFREGAPKAKLVYLTTTPVNDGKDPKVEKVGFDPRNDVVLRLNKIAKKVMAEENVEVIDLYEPMHKMLENMSRDRMHWKGEGYKFISDKVEKITIDELKKRGKLK